MILFRILMSPMNILSMVLKYQPETLCAVVS